MRFLTINKSIDFLNVRRTTCLSNELSLSLSASNASDKVNEVFQKRHKCRQTNGNDLIKKTAKKSSSNSLAFISAAHLAAEGLKHFLSPSLSSSSSPSSPSSSFNYSFILRATVEVTSSSRQLLRDFYGTSRPSERVREKTSVFSCHLSNDEKRTSVFSEKVETDKIFPLVRRMTSAVDSITYRWSVFIVDEDWTSPIIRLCPRLNLREMSRLFW